MGLWKAVHFGRLSASPLDGTVPLLMYCMLCRCTQESEDPFIHSEWNHCSFFICDILVGKWWEGCPAA